MFVGLCRLEIFVPEAASLKDKRKVLQSLIQRLQNRYNISVAEVGFIDIYRRGELGIAAVGNEKGHLEKVLHNLVKFVESDNRLEVLRVHTEYL